MDTLPANTFLQDQFNSWCTNAAVAVPTNGTGNSTRRGMFGLPPVQRRLFTSGRRRGVSNTGVQPLLEWADNIAPSSTGQWLYTVNYAATNADARTYCTANDELCRTLMPRTLCNKFHTYATAAGTTRNMIQTIRNEIFYKIERSARRSRSFTTPALS